VDVDYDRIRNTLRAKVGRLSCAACGHSGWDGPTALVGLPVIDGEPPTGNGVLKTADESSVVLVPISCAKCGFTHLFEIHTLMDARND